jgi:hypothetical protein
LVLPQGREGREGRGKGGKREGEKEGGRNKREGWRNKREGGSEERLRVGKEGGSEFWTSLGRSLMISV